MLPLRLSLCREISPFYKAWKDISLKTIDPKYWIFCFFGSSFAAFASYRLHLEGIEEFAFPILDAIVEFEGRAPDQYRILPYLLLSATRQFLELFFQQDIGWKYPIILFETLSLFLASISLTLIMRRNEHKVLVLLLLFLCFPFLMFDGIRATASFILLLSASMLLLCNYPAIVKTKVLFFFLLLAFSFTRADVALLVGLIASIYLRFSIVEKIIVALIPLIIQYLLITFIFVDAEYFSELIMIGDNISLVYFAGNPMSYLLIGLVIFFWEKTRGLISELIKNQPMVFILMVGYIGVIFIIGRPNEYRLFIAYLPIVLTILEQRAELRLQGRQ